MELDINQQGSNDPPDRPEGDKKFRPPGSNKRARFTRGRGRSSRPFQNRQGLQYERRIVPATLTMTPIFRYYTIYTSNVAIPTIADIIYSTISARVKNWRYSVKRDQFAYVINIVWLGRLCEITAQLGIQHVAGARDLIRTARAIHLPDFLIKYIETLGAYRMMNGLTVVPYCNEYRQMIPQETPWYLDPLKQLEDADRPDPVNEWSIDHQWISEFVQGTACLAKIGIELRTYRSEWVGSPELVVSYRDSQQPSQVTPVSPEASLHSVAELGASYKLRRADEADVWPFGDSKVLLDNFRSDPISPEQVISETFLGNVADKGFF